MRSFLVVAGVIVGLAAGLGMSGGLVRAASGYLVQLASMGSPEMAQRHWELLRAKNAELLGDMTLNVEEAKLGDRGTFYRIQIGPFPNEATAQDMCLQLKAQRLDCLVVRR
ncbi:MAG: SPOR domain-containing protein [Alphaproteobacteria bacterium]